MCVFPFGVFSARALEDWLRIPILCPPPRPQRPPQQPPPTPPQIHHHREDYNLLIPPMLGFNMNVHGVVEYPTGGREHTQILPGKASLMLRWRFFPMYDACPEILSTTTNQYIYTDLKSLKDLFATCRSHVVFPWRDIDITFHRYDVDWEGNVIMLDIVLYVFQLLYFSQSWLVAVYEVVIPKPPPGPIAPEYLRNKLNNRRERLYLFYDSEINGFGAVFSNIGGYGASVYPSHTVLYHNGQIAYTLRPTSGIAYFMLTTRTQ